MAEQKKYWLDHTRNVKKVIWSLYVVCGLSVIAEFFIHRHVDHPWEAMFGFYALYGCAACVVLVLIAKELRKFIMRGEDYYNDRP